MIPYLVFGLASAVLLALAWWRPEEDTLPDILRSYFLVLIGALLAAFAADWIVSRLGYPELALGDGLFVAVFGAGTALGALTRFRPYWQVASLWPLFRHLPERRRQVALIAAGLTILWLGYYRMAQARTAYLSCVREYEAATNSHERVTVQQRVASPTLRAYRGARPYTCGQLLEKHDG